MHDKFLYVDPPGSEEWISFWKDSLRNVVSFFKSKGITNYSDLSKFNARALIEPPLWRFPETNGKYHIRFFSREVWERTLKENKLPSRGTGKWSSSRAEVMLEHVVERASLISWILEDPTRIDRVEEICVGCVVSKEESKKLPSKRPVDPNDIWKRYLEGKVDVYDRMKARWHILDGKVI